MSILWLFDGSRALSALVAGVVVVVPSAWFAWRVETANAVGGEELDAARRLLGSGVAKLVLTVGLLVVALVWFRPEPVVFFATLIVLQLAYWLAPLLERR